MFARAGTEISRQLYLKAGRKTGTAIVRLSEHFSSDPADNRILEIFLENVA
jgi:hypothetical protein